MRKGGRGGAGQALGNGLTRKKRPLQKRGCPPPPGDLGGGRGV